MTGARARPRRDRRSHDIGLQSCNATPRARSASRSIVGGGQGRTPYRRRQDPRVPARSATCCPICEAILRVYNRTAAATTSTRRASRSWSHEIGAGRISPSRSRPNWATLEGRRAARCRQPRSPASRAYFAPPAFEPAAPSATERSKRAGPTPAFARWSTATSPPHKMPGYAIVTMSLKRSAGRRATPRAEQMDAVADLAERYSLGELRVTHEQNLVLPHVARDDLPAVYDGAGRARPRHAQHRPDHRHHRLPGPRLLRARQRPLDPDRPAASRSVSPIRSGSARSAS